MSKDSIFTLIMNRVGRFNIKTVLVEPSFSATYSRRFRGNIRIGGSNNLPGIHDFLDAEICTFASG